MIISNLPLGLKYANLNIKVKQFFQNFKDPKYLVKIALVAAVYFASAKFGLSFAFGVRQVSVVWPPTGIAIAVLLLFGPKFWPGILIGAFASNITTMETVSTALAISIGNTLEGIFANYLLSRFNFDKSFHKVSDIIKFDVLAAGVATLVSATIGTITLGFGGTISWLIFWPTWLTWWLGDATGAIIYAPLILSLPHLKHIKFDIFKILEGMGLLSSTIIVSLLVFTSYLSMVFMPYPIQYIIFPLMIWAALSFGIPGTTWTTFILSIISILGFEAGGGHFATLENSDVALTLLQVLVSTFSVTSMVLAATIEERRNFQDKIEQNEKKFRALIENSSDVIVLMDKTGRIRYTSPSTYKVLKFTPDELLGTSAFDRIHPEDRLRLISLFQKLVDEPGKTINATFRLIRKDQGIIWVDGTGSNLLEDPSISSIIINYRDVTEHQKIDEAKTEFVSLSAHQLRSPLSTIRWYTEALMKEKTFPKSLKSYLLEVYEAVLNMNETISLLLDISKFELGTVQVSIGNVDLNSIVDEILISKNKQILDKNLTIIKDYKNEIPEIIGDARLIKIIIENLISNAIKYTSQGGKITLNFTPEKDTILFKITDTGIGIPVKDQEKIFTKLYRGSNVKEVQQTGLGLGLYLIRLIIDLKGGSIWFESEEGKGTTFFVEFPKKIEVKK